jgi:DNA polymerase-1
MSKLVLIDGNAILHRAYHALPKTLTNSKGELTNAVYGFTSMLLRIIEDLKPTHLAVCFERKEPTVRKEEVKQYQAHRPETDKGLVDQFQKARDVLESMNIRFFEKSGYEADDLIGTMAKKAGKSKGINEVIIITGDRDILQLVDDKRKIKVYMPIKGLSKSKLYGEKEVLETLKVTPKQVVDYKALVGDPSDNYPGVTGIGPKTAEKLLSEYNDYKNVYKNLNKIDKNIKRKLVGGREGGDTSYKLARIVDNVVFRFELNKLDSWKVGSKDNVNLFVSYGFKTLTRRVLGVGSGKKGEQLKFKKNLSKEEVERIVIKVAKKLKNKQYAIRGTASMVLQGLDMGVDDIDMIADKKTSLLMNKLFKDNLVEEVEYKESEKFKSYYGKIVIDEILIEVMGEFQVKDTKGNWGEIVSASKDEFLTIELSGQEVNVTNLDLELELSAKMGRWNEYHKIKKQLEERDQQSLF